MKVRKLPTRGKPQGNGIATLQHRRRPGLANMRGLSAPIQAAAGLDMDTWCVVGVVVGGLAGDRRKGAPGSPWENGKHLRKGLGRHGPRRHEIGQDVLSV